MNEIKPVACVSKIGIEHLDPYDPPPLFPADEYEKRTDVYLYDQQAIDSLRAELKAQEVTIGLAREIAGGTMRMGQGLIAEYAERAERAEAEVERLKAWQAEVQRSAFDECERTDKAEAELDALRKSVKYANDWAQLGEDEAGKFICIPPNVWARILEHAAIDAATKEQG